MKSKKTPNEWAVACYGATYDAIARLHWLIGPAAVAVLVDQLEALAPGIEPGCSLPEHLQSFGKVLPL
jgi:hypothetical protein